MPRIYFVEGEGGREKEVDVDEGGPLVDICDYHRAPIAFSCRSATCATCQIEVVSGAELLEPPNEEETELLDILGGPPGLRLACQAVVKPGGGVLKVKPAGS